MSETCAVARQPFCDDIPTDFGYDLATLGGAASTGERGQMIRNGLYSICTESLDGVDGGDNGVMVLRDGGILGGTSFFYLIGTYSCSGGRWKGEITHQEHNLAPKPTTRWRLPEPIPTRVPNSKPRRSSASEAFGSAQACGCC